MFVIWRREVPAIQSSLYSVHVGNDPGPFCQHCGESAIDPWSPFLGVSL